MANAQVSSTVSLSRTRARCRHDDVDSAGRARARARAHQAAGRASRGRRRGAEVLIYIRLSCASRQTSAVLSARTASIKVRPPPPGPSPSPCPRAAGLTSTSPTFPPLRPLTQHLAAALLRVCLVPVPYPALSVDDPPAVHLRLLHHGRSHRPRRHGRTPRRLVRARAVRSRDHHRAEGHPGMQLRHLPRVLPPPVRRGARTARAADLDRALRRRYVLLDGTEPCYGASYSYPHTRSERARADPCFCASCRSASRSPSSGTGSPASLKATAPSSRSSTRASYRSFCCTRGEMAT